METFCRGKGADAGHAPGPPISSADVKLKDLELGENILVAAIIRDNQLITPGDDSKTPTTTPSFSDFDRPATWISQRLSGKEARRAEKSWSWAPAKWVPARGALTADQEQRVKLKLIDADLEKCRGGGGPLPKHWSRHGSGTDLNFLRQENIESTDVFIAVSGNDGSQHPFTGAVGQKLRSGDPLWKLNRPDYAFRWWTP